MTAFIVGNGETAADVKALVESWTRAGILKPSLWVTPQLVVENPLGPPSVGALFVHEHGSDSVDLFEHIGRFRLDLVRLVAAHLVLLNSEPDLELANAANVVSSAIEAALPRRVDAATAEGSRLHRSLVVLPVSGANSASADILKPRWEVNAVISPEDRPDLDRASIFVREPGNFAGHAASALAAIGGVFRGVDVGVLDELGTDSTTGDRDVVVARVSIRSIVGEDLLDKVAADVLATGSLDAPEPSEYLSWARPATESELLVSSAADAILHTDDWVASVPPASSSIRTRHQSFGAALRTAALFNLRTVGAVVSWVLTKGRARVEKRATDVIVGANAGTLVTLGPRPISEIARVSADLLERERNRIDDEMRLQSSRVRAPQPSTWQSLRKLCFGLADGGELGDFPEPRQAGKRELLSPTMIVPKPGETWSDAEGRKVSAEDSRAMHAHRRLLAAELSEAKHGWDAAATELRKAQEEREQNPPPKETKAAYWPSDKDLKNLKAAALKAESAYKQTKSHVDAYNAWFELQARTILWKVGDNVARRIDELQSTLDEISKRKSDQVPPAQRLHTAQRALLAWWGWTLGLALLAVGVFAYLTWGALPDEWEDLLRITGETFLYAVASIGVITVVVIALANHGFYKEVRRYEWQVEILLDQMAKDKTRFVHAGQEKARLELLYEVLMEWARIIGHTLYEPWARFKHDYEPLPDNVIQALPAAAGLAQQPGGTDSVDQAVRTSAYNVVYQRGWSSRNFEAAYEAWSGTSSRSASEGYRATDLDTHAGAVSPRKLLLRYWESDAPREHLSRLARANLENAFRDGTLELPSRVVSRVGKYGDGKVFPERDFFEAMATESTTFGIELFTATGRQARNHYVDRSIAWLPEMARGSARNDAVTVRTCSGSTAIRVDISRRIHAGELTTFTRHDLSDPSTTQADDVVPNDEVASESWF
ncbi:hypothetical protein [Cryobacterium sp. BB736]|uniref:hypothetical protein n=1 Tax=Cryobacterium sp. BB736 TaxID=2746963 RepID=UPI001876FCAE|nr:hypothetical protein [Cryobacterium sp. BB736]